MLSFEYRERVVEDGKTVFREKITEFPAGNIPKTVSLIYSKIREKDLHYAIKSVVSEQHLQEFFDFITHNGDDQYLTCENAPVFWHLCDEFLAYVLQEKVEKFMSEKGDVEQLLTTLVEHRRGDNEEYMYMIEEAIAKRGYVLECVKRESFHNLPISIIHRILCLAASDIARSNTACDIICDFVGRVLEQRGNEALCLVDAIQWERISVERLKRILEIGDKIVQQVDLPNIKGEFIGTLLLQIDDLKRKNEEMEESIHELRRCQEESEKRILDTLRRELDLERIKLQEQITTAEQCIEEFQVSIRENHDNLESLRSELEKQMKTDLNLHEQRIKACEASIKAARQHHEKFEEQTIPSRLESLRSEIDSGDEKLEKKVAVIVNELNRIQRILSGEHLDEQLYKLVISMGQMKCIEYLHGKDCDGIIKYLREASGLWEIHRHVILSGANEPYGMIEGRGYGMGKGGRIVFYFKDKVKVIGIRIKPHSLKASKPRSFKVYTGDLQESQIDEYAHPFSLLTALVTESNLTMILDEQNAENLKDEKEYTELFEKTYETKCLVIKPDKSWGDKSFFNVDEVEFISDQNGSGVFETLRKKYKDDIREHVYIAAPFDTNSIHLTEAKYNISTKYLQVFIKAGRLSITGYRFTDTDKKIRSWILAGSNNQTDWTTLDERKDYEMTDTTEYFEVNVRNIPLFKYFRLTHVGTNWTNDSSSLKLRHFDLFGSYLPDV